MRFTYPYIENVFDFENGRINSLVIENPALFYEIVSDIYNQCEGAEGNAVLSENFTPVPFSKNAEIIMQLVPFEINRKNLITKLNSLLEKNAVSEEFFLPTGKLMTDIEKWIFDLSFSLPSDIEISKLSPGSIIKALGLSFISDSPSLPGKIIDYMELVRELDKDRLFIFINLRSYLRNEECEAFFETVLSHSFRIFLIDSAEKQRFSAENRVLIDGDLCEV